MLIIQGTLKIKKIKEEKNLNKIKDELDSHGHPKLGLC